MKYYLGEYWTMMNSKDKEIRETGIKRWQESTKVYAEYFNSIKNKLPKGFLKTYDKINFHDFQLSEINIKGQFDKDMEISLLLYDYYEDYGKDVYYQIIYSKVSKYMCDIYSEYGLGWGYDEFELHENGIWEHRIICSNGAELEIAFKRIKVKKISRNKSI